MMIREACQAGGFNDAVRRADAGFCTGNKTDQAIVLTTVCRWQFSDLVAAGFSVTDNGGRCWTNPSAYTDAGGIAVNHDAPGTEPRSPSTSTVTGSE